MHHRVFDLQLSRSLNVKNPCHLAGISFFGKVSRKKTNVVDISKIILESEIDLGYNDTDEIMRKEHNAMKELNLLVWLTQLGLSVAVPPILLIWLGLWLHKDLGWGIWVLWACIILGAILAIDGLRTSLKAMERLSKNKKDDGSPPVSFNDHS